MAIPLDFDLRGMPPEPEPEPHVEFRHAADTARHGAVLYRHYPGDVDTLTDQEIRGYWDEFKRRYPGV